MARQRAEQGLTQEVKTVLGIAITAKSDTVSNGRREWPSKETISWVVWWSWSGSTEVAKATQQDLSMGNPAANCSTESWPKNQAMPRDNAKETKEKEKEAEEKAKEKRLATVSQPSQAWPQPKDLT